MADPHRLKPTKAYEAARRALRPEARISLGFVEEAIANDPDDIAYRFRRQDGSGIIVDRRAEGLLVAYRRVDANVIELVALIDLKSPPLWP